MFYKLITGRVLAAPSVLRLSLTRPISTTHTLCFPKAAKETKSKAVKKTTPKVKKIEKKVKLLKSEIPQRPSLSAYLVYCADERARLPKPTNLVEAHAQMKEIGKSWGALTEADKEPLRARAAAENVKLAEVYDNWRENVDPQLLKDFNTSRKKAGRQRIAIPDSQKVPMSSFMRFLRDYRQEHLDLSPVECSRQAGNAWHASSHEVREKYNEEYRIAKEEFIRRSNTLKA